MEKWTETKDLEEVAEAMRNGLRVTDIYGADLCLDDEGFIVWAIDKSNLFTLPGRIFRIEVPRPEAPEGWEIVPHGDKKQGMIYFDKVWLVVLAFEEQRRDRWYARKKEETPEPKMVRVGFEKDSFGILSFRNHIGLFGIEKAPSVLGPGGYKYEGFDGLYTSPVMFVFSHNKQTNSLVASVSSVDLEAGRAVPVLPVAYWYVKKEG